MKHLGKKLIWLVFLIVVALLIVVIYLIPGAGSLFAMTSVAERGEITKSMEATAWIVRTETVYSANASGTVQYFFEEGERVRKNSKLYAIVQANKPVYADRAGIVCYSIDEGEGVLTPETMETIPRADVESFEPSEKAGQSGNVFTGQKLLKLVDEDLWYLLFWVEESEAANFEKGKTVEVVFENEETLPAAVYSVREEEDAVRIVLSLSRYYEKFASVRKQPVTVVTSNNTGLLIRNSALTFEQNIEGVYVKQVAGDYRFVPVHVLATDGTYSVCEEGTFTRTTSEGTKVTQQTIHAYDEILNSPRREQED